MPTKCEKIRLSNLKRKNNEIKCITHDKKIVMIKYMYTTIQKQRHNIMYTSFVEYK